MILVVLTVIVAFLSRSNIPKEVSEIEKEFVKNEKLLAAGIYSLSFLMAYILVFIGNMLLFKKSRRGFFSFFIGNILGLLSLIFIRWTSIAGIAQFLGETTLFLAAIIITIYIYEWYE